MGEKTATTITKIFPELGWSPSYWQVSQLESLSLAALGLHTHLMSLPDGWDISSARLAQRRKEGRDSIRRAMKDLEKAGLLEHRKERAKDGTVRTRTYVYALPKADIKPQVTPGTDFQAPVKSPGRTGDGFTGAGETGSRFSRPLRRDTQEEIQKEKEEIPPPPSPSDGSATKETTTASKKREEGGKLRQLEKQHPQAAEFVAKLPAGGKTRGKTHHAALITEVARLIDGGADLGKVRVALVNDLASAGHWFSTMASRAAEYDPKAYMPAIPKAPEKPTESATGATGATGAPQGQGLTKMTLEERREARMRLAAEAKAAQEARRAESGQVLSSTSA